MDFFESAFLYTMADEGGEIYTDRPGDSPTKWGVSLKFYRQYRKNPNLEASDIKEITEDEARHIAKVEFWDRLNLTLCKHESVAIALLNQAYLKGPSGCAACAQWAVKLSGAPIRVDGVLGVESWKVINQMDPKAFMNGFVGNIIEQYKALVFLKPEDRVNLNGWMNRAQRLLDLV